MNDLASITKQELSELLLSLGEPAFRAKQVMEWLSRGVKPAEMTNLPKTLRQKLAAIRPKTVGEAMRISGVSPADISALLLYTEEKGEKKRDGAEAE